MYVKFKSCTAQEYSNALAQGTIDSGTLYLVTTNGGLGSTSPQVRAELYIGNRHIAEELAAPILDIIKVLDAALNELGGDVEAINVDNIGDAHCKSMDMDNLPKVCGYPSLIEDNGTPSVAPDFKGQIYIDKNKGNVYFGKDTSSVYDWKRIDNE